jgi:hypothetical protein
MGASMKRLRKRTGAAGRGDGDNGSGEVAVTEEEHLARALARVRARFGVDPATALAGLASAWQEPLASDVEEDEAELVDAMADCLGAGFTLDEALSCWDAGQLVDDRADEPTDEPADDKETPATLVVLDAAVHASGRRVLVR